MTRTFLAALVAALVVGVAPAAAQEEDPRVLLYTGTTGYRHADAINQGAPIVTAALQEQGYVVDREDCIDNGGGPNNCDNAAKNPRIFTPENLAKYDAILFFNASASWAGGGKPGPLWDAAQRQAIIQFVQQGGGIAANHNATDMGAGAVSWDWWDGPNGESVVGSLMRGHAATDQNNLADVQVADNHHLSTRDLPDTYEFGDEHYNFARSVRGTHHVLATLDERTYAPGGNAMGQDHPISWCKLYDGDNVMDGTGVAKPYNDGRTWVSGMGHFGSSYTANGGDNELVEQIVGGVRWVAGEGKKSDCSGTVWSSFKRTILVNNINGPIGLDTAPDGKVYWSEIGPNPGYESEGYVKVHDPEGEPGNKTTVATIQTRADHALSEDGVLGMALEPGFDLADPAKRDVFVYYSPRNPAWPTTGNQIAVGYNQISRFTLGPEGTAVVPGSERVILRVPKAKISGSPSGFPGGPSNNGPGHVGGAGLDFDSDGSLYLGVGDDVSPNAEGHNQLVPMDHRAAERWDARKTAANSADLRGKVLRIKPADDIAAGAEPGLGTTYTVPEGNMFAPGTAKTRPEIYAMGFRQPFTVKTDPANPGNVVVGEYCHDAGSNVANRAPAGVCEWNLVDEPGFHGWPQCMGDNAPDNTSTRWNYASATSTNQKYDCNQAEIPSDIRWAPEGQTAVEPTFDGLDTLPGPAKKATIWKKDAAPGNHPVAEFGDLGPGGRSPVTGPVYRYNADTAGPGAFPPYYDGAWFITNRGTDSGFWKEVQLRQDDDEMLRVNGWAPAGHFGTPNNAFVIPTDFGPDGALYMAKWNESCCRTALNPDTQNQLIKVEFAVQDECLEDTEAPNTGHALAGREHPTQPGKYVDDATLTITAGDAGCAGVDTVEYRIGSGEWQRYTEPVAFDEVGSYSVDYRATDRMDNVAAIKTVAFEVVELNDQAAPTVSAEVSGTQTDEGYYAAPATVTIEAVDELSPIATIEYRVNQADEWTTTDLEGEELSAELQKQFGDSGFQYVEFRATDDAGNVSEIGSVEFSVIACTYGRSDEFDGTALDARWLRHTRNGGTPTTGPLAPTVADGKLSLPTNDLELDGSNTATAAGPANFVGQDLAALGDNWTVETQFTVTHTGGWQGVGLMLWQADNNFFRSTISHNLGSGVVYVEQSKDNPTSTEGARVQSSGNPTILPAKGAVTIQMRYARAAGANTVTSQYRIMAPASAATPDWVNFPGISAGLDLNPAGGSRRDAAGSRVGLYAGGNFPGTTGTHPYPGTPADVKVDYFRVTPDTVGSCPDDDVEPPATTAALDPAEPAPGPVNVNFSATDGTDENASGVAATEYRVDGGEWQVAQNGGSADPFTSSVTVSAAGEHTVAYRSRDEAGNLEVADEIEFTVEGGGSDDTTPPVTAHALDPSSPGAGGTYSGPVGVTLSATDPEEGSEPGEPQTHDVNASGALWTPTEVDAVTGDVVRWNFPAEMTTMPHDVWLVPPGGNPDPAGSDMYQVTSGLVSPGGPPVSETLDEAGTWTYVCKLHAGFSGGAWTGMVGTVDVTEGGGGGPEASGVEFTEYRVNSDGENGAWVRSDNDAEADPFETEFTVSAPGSHVVEYRSTDGAGNDETAKSVAFSISDGPGEGTPTVEGFAEPTTGPAPLRVRFSATGLDPDGGALTYRWQFPNGAVLKPTASYTFTEPGTHTATVTATDDEGDTATDTVEITVLDPDADNEPPTVTASVDKPSGAAPHRVKFDATGVDPDGRNADLVYHWEFGDGGESLARRPGHTYREPGDYTAKVTVTDPYGDSATAEVDVEVTDGSAANRPPTVQAAAAPGSGMAPLSVQLSAQATDPDGDRISYSWEFGDGQGADGRSVRYVYILSGTYTAAVTATDEAGATATDTVQIVVGNPPANQAPTVRVATDPGGGSAPLRVRFTSAASDPDRDPLMYVWEFGDGGRAGGPSAVHTYTAPGTYTAKLTVTDPHGATGSATVTVVVGARGGVQGSSSSRSAISRVSAPKTSARLAERGLQVTVRCASTGRARVTLGVSKQAAKRLKLKSRTVASRSVRCRDGRKAQFRMKIRDSAADRLAANRRLLKLTLRVKVKRERAVTRTLTVRASGIR